MPRAGHTQEEHLWKAKRVYRDPLASAPDRVMLGAI